MKKKQVFIAVRENGLRSETVFVIRGNCDLITTYHPLQDSLSSVMLGTHYTNIEEDTLDCVGFVVLAEDGITVVEYLLEYSEDSSISKCECGSWQIEFEDGVEHHITHEELYGAEVAE